MQQMFVTLTGNQLIFEVPCFEGYPWHLFESHVTSSKRTDFWQYKYCQFHRSVPSFALVLCSYVIAFALALILSRGTR